MSDTQEDITQHESKTNKQKKDWRHVRLSLAVTFQECLFAAISGAHKCPGDCLHVCHAASFFQASEAILLNVSCVTVRGFREASQLLRCQTHSCLQALPCLEGRLWRITFLQQMVRKPRFLALRAVKHLHVTWVGFWAFNDLLNPNMTKMFSAKKQTNKTKLHSSCRKLSVWGKIGLLQPSVVSWFPTSAFPNCGFLPCMCLKIACTMS